MQECLGISITNKLIRYAKVQKDNSNYKVSSYGIKFYDDPYKAVEQIINETNSNTTRIATGITKEKYYEFNIFSLTNKSYAEKAIKTEFDSFCTDNHLNANSFAGRYLITKNIDNPDQRKIIYMYDNKSDIDEKNALCKAGKLTTVTPVSTALSTLINSEKNKNSMIINLEEQTTVTTIINQSIQNIETISEGMDEIIEKINEKENSYLKSYEVCKNTTIYTMETSIENTTNNEYLQYIIPTLYKIVQEVQRMKESYKRIDNIYITGIGSVINNIDLYFKEYFKESKVEILKPDFLSEQVNTNIKDLIEVNSAIAVALQDLGLGVKNLNFNTNDWKAQLKMLLTSDVKSLGKTSGAKPLPSLKLNMDMKGKLNKGEINLIRDCIAVFLIIIMYGISSGIVFGQINNKIDETNAVISDTKEQVKLAQEDDAKIGEKTKDYQKYKTNLENVSSAIETKRSRKNQITTLLNKIVYIIPKEVKLTEIKNSEITKDEKTIQHIVIYAQSTRYEQLAYFKAKMKSNNVLDNITSTEGTKEGDIVKIVIEGDLRTY